MLISTQTLRSVSKFGLEDGISKLLDSGFDALDFSSFGDTLFGNGKDYREIARKLRKFADERGIVFNQAHATAGGGYENYTTNLIPTFPKVFEFCSILGVKNVIVHPLQRGRYYGHEK